MDLARSADRATNKKGSASIFSSRKGKVTVSMTVPRWYRSTTMYYSIVTFGAAKGCIMPINPEVVHVDFHFLQVLADDWLFPESCRV
jgi:hypothetical protein